MKWLNLINGSVHVAPEDMRRISLMFDPVIFHYRDFISFPHLVIIDTIFVAND